MVGSVTLTRHGWIRHLRTLQEMLKLVADIDENVRTAFGSAMCEVDRRKKIQQSMTKLQELVWETGAVAERIHRERGENDPQFDAQDRDMCNEETEAMLVRLWDAAKELERCARSLWDPDAPEVVDPDVVYPGVVGRPDEDDDPNQPLLGLQPAALDYKKKQANDDTTEPDGGEDGR